MRRAAAIADVAASADFNPRIRVGCDPNIGGKKVAILGFQSTHPCRMRQRIGKMQKQEILFQSTHPCRMRRGQARLLLAL